MPSRRATNWARSEFANVPDGHNRDQVCSEMRSTTLTKREAPPNEREWDLGLIVNLSYRANDVA